MAADKLAADTSMGPVTLNVADLDLMTRYYTEGVGLDVLSELGSDRVLGRGGREVLRLSHTPALKHAGPREAGLFHTAFLFESREALAASVYSVATKYPNTFTGSSDHLVSLAMYFDDPEHNGVELYWDRDRTQWSWTHGQIEMSTLFLDPNKFLQENLTEAGLEGPSAGDTTVGHVHLSVGDIEPARDFYVTKLGFDQTIEIPGQALFVSAGGYHHHMAMNVWNSRGAGRRQQTLGLGQVIVRVGSPDEVAAVADRLLHYNVPTRSDDTSVLLADPWGNSVRVTSDPQPAPPT
jgi:catechol 2,3-dioxygenase